MGNNQIEKEGRKMNLECPRCSNSSVSISVVDGYAITTCNKCEFLISKRKITKIAENTIPSGTILLEGE